MTTTTKPDSLEHITRAEADAAAAAQKAQVAAEAARAKADQARQRAEERRVEAYRSYLDNIEKAWPVAHDAALTTQAEAHAALEQAVKSGGDVFPTYLQWCAASVQVWEVDAERAHIRYHHGQPVRETAVPVFSFSHDIGAIVDQLAGEFLVDAEQRITARRTAFVNGRTA